MATGRKLDPDGAPAAAREASDGSSLDKDLRVTVYLARMDDYAAFNRIDAEHFQPPRPARSCIAAAGLAFGMKVELDAVARR